MTEIRCHVKSCKNNKFQEEYGVGICQAPILPLDTQEVESDDASEETETLFRCLAFVNVESEEELSKFALTIEESSEQFIEVLKKELQYTSKKEAEQ